MNEEPHPTLLGALWRFRTMAVAIVVAAVALSVAVGLAVTGSTRADGTIALTTPPADAVVTPGTQSEASLARFTEQRARFATSDIVVERVGEILGRQDIDELHDQIASSASGTSNTIVVSATADDADEAIRLVEATIEAYRLETAAEFARLTDVAVASIEEVQAEVVAERGDAASDAQARATADTVGDLQLDISELRTTQVVFGDGVDFVNLPRADEVADSSPPVRQGLLGLVVGLVLAATAAWLRADSDAGIESGTELEATIGAPDLGVVRERSDLQLLSPLRIEESPSNDYRLVWAALRRRMPSGVIMVASEGVDARSVAALNIAAAAARDNRSVLLVDADLRTSQISFALSSGQRRSSGVWTVLADDDDWREVSYRPDPSELPTLTVLPAGTGPKGPASVATDRVESAVAAWREEFDLVVLDAQDVTTDQVSATLCGTADGVLVVVGRGTDARRVDDLRRRVELQGSRFVGGILAAAP